MIADALAGLAVIAAALWSVVLVRTDGRRSEPRGERPALDSERDARGGDLLLTVGPPALLVFISLAQLGWSLSQTAVWMLAASGVLGALLVVSARVTGVGKSRGVVVGAWTLSCLGAVTAERLYTGSGVGQAQWLAIGAGVFLVAAFAGSRWRSTSTSSVGAVVAGVGCGLLILPLMPVIGVTINGAPGWIALGPFTGQPGDLARALIVVGMGTMFYAAGPTVRAGRLGPIARSSWPLVVAVTIGGLTNDLGPVLVLGAATVCMLVLCGPPARVLAGVVAVLAAAAAGMFLGIGKLRERLDQMLHPITADGLFQNTGLAQRALARGGLLGQGFGRGDPHMVANVDNDFVLAGIGEERGTIVLVAVFVLFAAVTTAAWANAMRATSGGPRLVAGGLASMLTVQAVYVVCAAMNIAPVTGMVVPFLSRGGSSLTGAWMVLGILVGLGAHRRQHLHGIAMNQLADRITLARRSTTAVWILMTALLLVLPAVRPSGAALAAADDGPGGVAGELVFRDGTRVVLQASGDDIRRPAEDVPGDDRPAIMYVDSVTGFGTCDASWYDDLVLRGPCRTVVGSVVPNVQNAARAGFTDGGVEGDAVAIDLSTGEVLALYSSPGSIDSTEMPGDQRGLPAVHTNSAPGSTFKVVVATAALAAGSDTVTPIRDSYTPPGGAVEVHNAGLVAGGGTLEQALAESSNTAFAEIATRTGAEPIEAMTHQLSSWPNDPGSVTGLPEITVGSELGDPDALARTGFGQQDVRATPFTMAVATGMIATDGRMPSPRLQSGLCDGPEFLQDVITRREPTLNQAISEPVLRGMRDAVEDGHAGAFDGQDAVGAKTGTADNGSGVYDGWVVAVSPVDDPRVVVAVRVWASAAGESRTGAVDATPIASNVRLAAERWLEDDVNPCVE